LRSRRAMRFRRFMDFVSFPPTAPWSVTEMTFGMLFAERVSTPGEFSRATSRPIYRSSERPNSNWSSILRPPRNSASLFQCRCSAARRRADRISRAHVRYWHKADMALAPFDVCLWGNNGHWAMSALPPKSGHRNSVAKCPLSARSGHLPRVLSPRDQASRREKFHAVL
jgi:hypothetical protein